MGLLWQIQTDMQDMKSKINECFDRIEQRVGNLEAGQVRIEQRLERMGLHSTGDRLPTNNLID